MRGPRRTVVCALYAAVSIAASVVASRAAAQSATAPAGAASSPDADPKAEAKAHFEKARALAENGAWPAAAAEFLASRRLYATWGNTLGAASSLVKLQRFDEALDLFEILLKAHSALPADVKVAAQRQLVELRGLVGTIELDGPELGAAITVDGRERGDYPTPEPIRVSAGSHLVRVSREGYGSVETRVDVAGGITAHVRVKLRLLTDAGRLRVTEQRGRALAVLVDGASVGTTPWEGLVAVGDHVVVLRGPGALGTPPVSVPVKRAATTPLTLAAEELTAELRVEPMPVAASVAIDAVAVGRGLWEGRLRAGPHKIEVADAGFVPAVREVKLDRGERSLVSVALQRDPTSPFWRARPPPPHVLLEATASVPVSPGLGGDVVGGCVGACSASPGVGFLGVLRAGYELSSGLSFGGALGYLLLRQTASGRPVTLQPVGLPRPDAATVDDTLALRRGALAGGWIAYSLGSRFPLRARLGLGAMVASVADTRQGTLTLQRTVGTAPVGPLSVSGYAPLIWAAPEVRIGVRMGKHVELSLGLEAMLLVPLTSPSWPKTQEINAGSDGIGSFAEERLLGKAVVVVSPGMGARYDF